MLRSKEILCPKCGHLVTTEEQIRYMVLMNDLKCPMCNTVVVYATQVTY